MIDFGCIKTIAPGCLDRDENMSIHDTRNKDTALFIHHDTAGRLPQSFSIWALTSSGKV